MGHSPWSLSPESVLALLQATSAQDCYQWAIDELESVTKADLTTIATRDGALLVPRVTSGRENLGHEHSIPVDTTIPGSAFLDGKTVIVDDWTNKRGNTETVNKTSTGMVGHYRSLLCVPVRDHGVLLALSRAPDAFDDAIREPATKIGQILTVALDTVVSNQTNTPSMESETLEEIGRLVSHDLTNKLSVASGRIELAQRDRDFEQLEASKRALDGIESIAQITATLARTGAPIDEVESVSVQETAQEVFASLEIENATLSTVDGMTIDADRGCLVQILENLFRNASEHTEGAVSIRIESMDDGFFVADDGPGIPTDLRETVRKPGVSTRSENAGKGLTIVDRLASAHGWSMNITDSAEGGTRIEFHDVEIT